VTGAEVAVALQRLRQAGAALRARPAREVHAALADVFDAWAAADSPWQKRLVESLPATSGFAAETVREGLARALAGWTGAAFHALVSDELGGPRPLDARRGPRAAGFDVTAAVLAGAIPMPSLLSILAPLALRSPVLAKPSAHDPVTASLVARALAERDAPLGACVGVADFRAGEVGCTRALCDADCVVATGSDEAVAALAEEARRVREASARPSRFLGHGHRVSVAVLGPGASRGDGLARAAADLALDVALWDQLGCLSPVSVHVIDADAGAAVRVAEALAEALARAQARWPRGRVDLAAAAALARERDLAELRAAGGAPVTVRAAPGGVWTVVREADADMRPAPRHRFVRVHPATDAARCLDALRPLGARLAGVALAGLGRDAAPLAMRLAELGASRGCAPGALQSPPLAWRRDNLPVLLPLARWTDLEIDRRAPRPTAPSAAGAREPR
jgi:hypothetical protein